MVVPLSLLGVLLGCFVVSWRVLRGLRVRCCGGAAAVRFFFLRAPLAARVRCWRVVFVFWRVSRAGGAWALVRRCVFLFLGRAARVVLARVVFVFLARVAGGLCVGAAEALRFFCLGRAVRVLLARVVFVFLARVAGGLCVGAAAALRFFFLGRAARVLLARVVFVFLARVAGGRCVGAAAALRFFLCGACCASACPARAIRSFSVARRACCGCGAAFFFPSRAAGVRFLGVRFVSSGPRRWLFGPLLLGLLWRRWVRLVRLSGFLAFCAVVVLVACLLCGLACACARRGAAPPLGP